MSVLFNFQTDFSCSHANQYNKLLSFHFNCFSTKIPSQDVCLVVFSLLKNYGTVKWFENEEELKLQ